MKNKLVPALIGGASIFLISLLLALVPRTGFYTCFFTILGGTLAAYLYIRKSPTPVSVGEGFIVGALAGAIGGIIGVALFEKRKGEINLPPPQAPPDGSSDLSDSAP